MTRPSHETAEGRVYLELQRQARRDARPFDELLTLYTLEGFLARLAASRYARSLVLKGGLLLAAYEARRPTRDADFAGRGTPNDVEAMAAIVKEVALIATNDGLFFDIGSARGEVIRDEDVYQGVRIHLDCRLASATTYLKVDISVGDPIRPGPRDISIPRLLGNGEPISLVGYPLPMLHAEKIVTALQRGTVNTRWRDFADIYLLSRRHPIHGDELVTAIQTVARHRGAAPAPLSRALTGYGDVAGVQAKWAAWRRRQTLDDPVPESFAEVVAHVSAFADPALTGAAAGLAWRPEAFAWRTGAKHA